MQPCDSRIRRYGGSSSIKFALYQIPATERDLWKLTGSAGGTIWNFHDPATISRPYSLAATDHKTAAMY